MRRSLFVAACALIAATPVAADDGVKLDVSKLKNGLDLIVVEKHTSPVVTIEIAVKTGSFTETVETNGLSHFYEHMFFKGNAGLPSQAAYMARVAELGIAFNGTTSTERVNYFITLPSRNFSPGMTFMADALLSPLFNAEEMKSERKVVIGEYDRNEATPTHYLWRGLTKAMYGDQAYRKNPLGERKVIEAATRETMDRFRARFYVPNNACLLIVGDVNKTEAKVLAERLFGPRRWKKGADPHALPREPLPRLKAARAFVTTEKASPTQPTVLAMRWPGPDVGRDERATFVADVWGTLCGLSSARLQKRFRERKLATDVSLAYYTQREGGEINFSAVVQDDKLTEVRDTLLAETTAMARAGYWTDEDLRLAKTQLKVGRAYEAENGAALAHTLSFWWASSSVDYYQRYLAATESVTHDELRAFVRNYIVGRPMVVGCLATPAAQARLGLKTPDALLPTTAAHAAVASAVEELTLPNGVRVVFRREPAAAVNALQVFFDGGCLDLTEKRQGLDRLLLATLFDGSKQTARDALQAELVALGARTDSDTNYDYTRISVTAPGKGFPRAVELLGECLREPRLDPESVGQRRSAILTALGAEKADPDRYVVRVLNRVFFANHPYALRPDGTPESVKDQTAEDLRTRLSELLISGRIVLVLVGNMTRAAAQALLTQQFGFIPNGKWVKKPLPAFTPKATIENDTRPIPLSYVLAKCSIPPEGHADYPAARLATSLLSRKLWGTLRTKHAITYAVSAGLSRYRANYGYLYVSTRLPERAVRLMHEDIRALQTTLVPPTDLKGQIAQIETRLYSRSESTRTHAEGLGHAELVGGSWRSYYTVPQSLSGVTPEDVRQAARKYLKGFAFGVIGPKPVSAAAVRPEAGRH